MKKCARLRSLEYDIIAHFDDAIEECNPFIAAHRLDHCIDETATGKDVQRGEVSPVSGGM